MVAKHKLYRAFLAITLFWVVSSNVNAEKDQRKFAEMPKMMQEHQLANMRDHLMAINEILLNMGNNNLDKAAEIAETRLGMSSLSTHGASDMVKVLPKEMAAIGTSMHRAASRFALKAEEGDAIPAYKALQEVTSACVACHAGYKTHETTSEKNKKKGDPATVDETKIDKRINLNLTSIRKI